jgi:lipoprotein-releasing system permease protein
LNAAYFIARRILSGDRANFSRPIVRIAIVSIAIGLTVMFVSIAILTGFQNQIREKVIGFGAHILISHYNENPSTEPKPVSIHQDFYPGIEKVKGINHIQVYATKAGIIKSKEQIQGVVLKGVGDEFNWSFFRDKIVEGVPFTVSDTEKTNDVLISKSLANLLQIKLNDDLRMYFIAGGSTLGRKFKVCGLYETGMSEFDNVYVIGDIHHVQKLNGWTGEEVEGFEVFIDHFDDLDRLGEVVYKSIGFSLDATTIQQVYPQIFDWLDLQDTNVIIILALMVLVAAITMISTLLILIIERTNMIGILKALGMKNGNIRRIFLFNSIYIIGIGMVAGNLMGITLCLLQQNFGLISLPQESYYVSVVPIHLDTINILLLNAGTLVVCSFMLIAPSFIITRIHPVNAIRFD